MPARSELHQQIKPGASLRLIRDLQTGKRMVLWHPRPNWEFILGQTDRYRTKPGIEFVQPADHEQVV